MKVLAAIALLTVPPLGAVPLLAPERVSAAPPQPPATGPATITQTAPADPDATVRAPATATADVRAEIQQSCPAPSPAAVPDGTPIVVSLPPARVFTVGGLTGRHWRNPPLTDPSWRLGWYSFRWLTPLVRRAQADGQQRSLAALTGQLLRFYRDYPDPGRPVPGWDEGSSLRRLENLNCMYSFTGDARLAEAMRAEADVLSGNRYYGPPYRRVHNHGLMANLRLIEAGRLTGRTGWVQRARDRILAEAAQAVTPQGTSVEQSSTYQGVNTQLWSQAASILAGPSPAGENDPAVRSIRAVAVRAGNVAQWLTEPDGNWVQIGDATRTAGMPAPGRTDPGLFRDDAAGLIAGRWSWPDPDTTYYTVRYGPERFAHGHPDKGAVTWTTSGTRILTGSGYFGYDPASPFVRWQQTPGSSNTAFPAGARMNRTGMRVASASIRPWRHFWKLTSGVYGRTHTRTIAVTHAGRSLTVTDAFTGKGAAEQVWHLDPQWQLKPAPPDAQEVLLRHPDGKTLRMRTTGRVVSARRGSTSPLAGWNFPRPGMRVPAWELRVRWDGRTAATTFTVR